ncbi:hypothetical protein NDU88_004367 [Pleurodeles waltl]|uniref:Uncharacterized protein n=1 Tax=Pleurodeles waltl TaxID=8319 RepID=A0AAV7UJ07_PLEWA|nr:hypothetical protein NDU88_004367 [Pleurodeles waltl]
MMVIMLVMWERGVWYGSNPNGEKSNIAIGNNGFGSRNRGDNGVATGSGNGVGNGNCGGGSNDGDDKGDSVGSHGGNNGGLVVVLVMALMVKVVMANDNGSNSAAYGYHGVGGSGEVSVLVDGKRRIKQLGRKRALVHILRLETLL